jgi:hypothetical protein
MIAQTFGKLVDLQKATSYPFPIDEFTRRFLAHDAIILDEDKLWRASRICEPPPEPYPYTRIRATLLSADVPEEKEETPQKAPTNHGFITTPDLDTTSTTSNVESKNSGAVDLGTSVSSGSTLVVTPPSSLPDTPDILEVLPVELDIIEETETKAVCMETKVVERERDSSMEPKPRISIASNLTMSEENTNVGTKKVKAKEDVKAGHKQDSPIPCKGKAPSRSHSLPSDTKQIKERYPCRPPKMLVVNTQNSMIVPVDGFNKEPQQKSPNSNDSTRKSDAQQRAVLVKWDRGQVQPMLPPPQRSLPEPPGRPGRPVAASPADTGQTWQLAK